MFRLDGNQGDMTLALVREEIVILVQRLQSFALVLILNARVFAIEYETSDPIYLLAHVSRQLRPAYTREYRIILEACTHRIVEEVEERRAICNHTERQQHRRLVCLLDLYLPARIW